MHDSQFETPINTINISRFNFINPRLIRWIQTIGFGYMVTLGIRGLIGFLIATLSPVAILAPVFTMLGHIMDIQQITTGSIYLYGTVAAGFIVADQFLSLPMMRGLFVKLNVKAAETVVQLSKTKIGMWISNKLAHQNVGNENTPSESTEIVSLEELDRANTSVMGDVTNIANAMKGLVTLLTPTRHFVQFSKKIPSLGAWLEHMPVPHSCDNEFHVYAYERSFNELKELVSVLPSDAFHRLVTKKDRENTTFLLDAIDSDVEPVQKFKLLLSMIRPELRYQCLSEELGLGTLKDPLVHQIDRFEFVEAWQVIGELLSKDERRNLALIKDRRGHSLFSSVLINFGAARARVIFEDFTYDEIKHEIKSLCLHGLNPLVEMFRTIKYEYAKQIFEILPKEVLKDVLEHKPKNWNVSIGQKILIIQAVSEERIPELIEQLQIEFNIQIPGEHSGMFEYRYYDLDKWGENLGHESNNTYLQIQKSLRSSGCYLRHGFVQRNETYPEDILGIEPYMESKPIVMRYKQLMKENNPDRDASKTNIAQKINLAKRFLLDENERKSYDSREFPDSYTLGPDPEDPNKIKITFGK